MKIDPAKKRSSLALLEPRGQAIEPFGEALEQLGQALERRMRRTGRLTFSIFSRRGERGCMVEDETSTVVAVLTTR